MYNDISTNEMLRKTGQHNTGMYACLFVYPLTISLCELLVHVHVRAVHAPGQQAWDLILLYVYSSVFPTIVCFEYWVHVHVCTVYVHVHVHVHVSSPLRIPRPVAATRGWCLLHPNWQCLGSLPNWKTSPPWVAVLYDSKSLHWSVMEPASNINSYPQFAYVQFTSEVYLIAPLHVYKPIHCHNEAHPTVPVGLIIVHVHV